MRETQIFQIISFNEKYCNDWPVAITNQLGAVTPIVYFPRWSEKTTIR